MGFGLGRWASDWACGFRIEHVACGLWISVSHSYMGHGKRCVRLVGLGVGEVSVQRLQKHERLQTPCPLGILRVHSMTCSGVWGLGVFLFRPNVPSRCMAGFTY